MHWIQKMCRLVASVCWVLDKRCEKSVYRVSPLPVSPAPPPAAAAGPNTAVWKPWLIKYQIRVFSQAPRPAHCHPDAVTPPRPTTEYQKWRYNGSLVLCVISLCSIPTKKPLHPNLQGLKDHFWQICSLFSQQKIIFDFTHTFIKKLCNSFWSLLNPVYHCVFILCI